MRKFFTIIASALLVLSAASCSKDNGGDFPPYYRVSTSWSRTSGTFGSSDFSQISAVTDKYVNTDFSSEKEAVSVYNDILSKTRNVDFDAPGESYFELYITKYVSRQVDEHTIQYEADPSYKSPVAHRWDAKGSRDL